MKRETHARLQEMIAELTAALTDCRRERDALRAELEIERARNLGERLHEWKLRAVCAERKLARLQSPPSA